MTESAAPRLAIIGCGAVVQHHLLPALRRIGWLPSVLVDPSEARLRAIAADLGRRSRGMTRSGEWESVADAFDAAIVAAPHSLHGPIGNSLLRGGKHVFMEKPLATSVSECEAMIDAADTARLTLSVGLLRRYLHVARWTRALIASGALGEVRRFDVREGSVFNWVITSPSMLSAASAGGGVLMDTGAHTLDLVQWWLGDVASVHYRDDSEGGVEADCILDLEMASGASGRLELSRTRHLRNTIRIEGTQGFVEVHLHKNEIVAGSADVFRFTHGEISPSRMPKQMFTELFDAELSDFRESVSSGVRVGVPGSEGLQSVSVIARAYAARQRLAMPWEMHRPASTIEGEPAGRAFPHGATVLVTGASGFIGGHLVERLVREHGANVRCLVRNLSQAARLARLPVDLVQADLLDKGAIDRAIEGADFVFHCAYDPRSRRQNLEGMGNLIEACTRHDVRRFVHVSTFSVYEPFPDGDLTEETRDGDKAWMYVQSKLDLERALMAAAREHRFPGTIIQPAIVYGPFGKSWTNAQAEMLLFGTPVLPDRGEGLCNCVYVEDLVDSLLLAAVEKDAVGERFVISGPEPVTWAAFYARIAQAVGAGQPEFWPRDRIAKTNKSLVRDVRLVLSNPKRIVGIIVRWNAARRALQAGFDALPPFLRDLVVKHYFERDERRSGETYLPDAQQLALYSARPVVRNDKASRLLGYAPRFDFESGMALTTRYLEWAYRDTRAATGRRDGATSRGEVEAANLANAS